MTKLIETIKDRCHECYACVRNCPVKAVRVKDRQAEVIDERCIHCGNCVRVCSQGAKKAGNELKRVEEMLMGNKKVIAGLAPSFPSYNPDLNLEDWKNTLYSLGFDMVYEVAWGAQLVIEEYRKLLIETDELVISSACPVIVNLIQKYYPSMVENLAPIVSPMKALLEYVKEVEGSDSNIVFIGPCLAKKGEFDIYDNCSVLTFSEIFSLEIDKLLQNNKKNKNLSKRSEKDIKILNSKFREGKSEDIEDKGVLDSIKNKHNGYIQDEEPADEARRFPLTGGLIKAVTGRCDFFPDGYLKVEGSDKVFDLLNEIESGALKPDFIDILFCEGCISGVDLSHENYFKKEGAINTFIKNIEKYPEQERYSYAAVENIELTTSFTTDITLLPQPTEDEIWDVLKQTGKYSEEDLLNCSACGYNSCREKAIAVYQGLAEVEMCLPYLISEKRSEIKEIQELNKELDTLINFSYDGMMMVDKEGRVERVNDAFEDFLGLSKKELMGREVFELERERIIFPSLAKLCLVEKREITLIQNTRTGHRLLTTASPIFDEENNIVRTVVNARNLDKLQELGGEEKLRQFLQKEGIEDQECPDHIISKSRKMNEILRLSRRVGKTDSSILIMGESGVGKEVVARFIHEQSPEREAFIKINCAAIPESLLESELFGYETGAFSGAKREGKPGLVEKAEGGTLFLDEIGEMPLNMQAKLLQVLQEHCVTRIGGTESINVDFRLITATNKNIKEMIENNEFRGDLYYRLNVVPIYIPPLRERIEDIEPLLRYYLSYFNKKYHKRITLSQNAVNNLISYKWPGNVRELSNLLERIVITSEAINIEEKMVSHFLEVERENVDKTIKISNIIPLPEAVSKVEKKLLAMAREQGKTTYQMAELLGVDQSTIVRKLKKYFA
ncbi:MAG: sigma 54-interacting transcriptional regulator [Halanaerobiales bacterium]